MKHAIVGFTIVWRRDGRKKDTLRNIEASKDFVFNSVTARLAEKVNQASAEYPGDVDELKEVGLSPVKAHLVESPMAAE